MMFLFLLFCLSLLLNTKTRAIEVTGPPNEWQNKVYGTGGNFHGQLGLNNRERTSDPLLLSTLYLERNVSRIVACDYSSFAITYIEVEEAVVEEGRLYAWGYNAYGQLGLGNKDSQIRPKLVAALADVVITDVACAKVPVGATHTLAVDKTGKVYAWGYNLYGQLGLNDTKARTSPNQVPFPPSVRVKRVFCGGFHSVAVDTNGKVYVWGLNDRGQLGIPSAILPAPFPQAIPMLAPLPIVTVPFEMSGAFSLSVFGTVRKIGPVQSAALGMYFTILRSASQRLFSTGANDQGQLGLGDFEDRDVFHEVEGSVSGDAEFVAAGLNHAVALGRNGLFTWGNNEFGQLGLSPESVPRSSNPLQIPFSSALMEGIGYNDPSLSAGIFHNVVVSPIGKVFSWGLGQHGQLASGLYESQANVSAATSPALSHRIDIENDVVFKYEDIIFVEAAAGAYHTLLRSLVQDCGNDPRFSLQCSGHGWCNVDSGKCHCDYPYTKELEEEHPTCGSSSRWCPNECSGHGICDKGTCLCQLEFQTLPDCSIGSCVDNCTSPSNGLCDTSRATCECTSNATHRFTGVACESRDTEWDVRPIDYNKYDPRFPNNPPVDTPGGKYTTTEYIDEEYSLSFPDYVEDDSSSSSNSAVASKTVDKMYVLFSVVASVMLLHL